VNQYDTDGNIMQKYAHWVHIATKSLEIELEGDSPEAAIWKWLLNIVEKLGVDGMSSEDTDNSNGVEVVYRVRVLPWHCKIDHELAIIDGKHLCASDIYAQQGAKPLKHLHLPNALNLMWKPVCKLPHANAVILLLCIKLK